MRMQGSRHRRWTRCPRATCPHCYGWSRARARRKDTALPVSGAAFTIAGPAAGSSERRSAGRHSVLAVGASSKPAVLYAWPLRTGVRMGPGTSRTAGETRQSVHILTVPCEAYTCSRRSLPTAWLVGRGADEEGAEQGPCTARLRRWPSSAWRSAGCDRV